MKTAVTFIVAHFLFTGLYAQNSIEYKRDPEISTEQGTPISKNPNFFPDAGIDTVYFNWFSQYLDSFKENIFCNFPFEFDSYRLTVVQSYENPMVITIIDQGKTSTLIVKKGSELNPDNTHNRLVNLSRSDSVFLEEFARGLNMDSTRMARIVEDNIVAIRDTVEFEFKTYQFLLDEDEIAAFRTLLAENHFSDLTISDFDWLGDDGVYFILEANTSIGYQVVYRWSPDKKHHPEFEEICQYLIGLSCKMLKDSK